MKKILALSALTLAVAAAPVQCAEEVKVMLDGNQLAFDVPPQIVEGRTLVPLRVIFEALGAEVEWDNDARKVMATSGETVVEMTIDNNIMKKNAEEITLDVAPCIIDDRTLVPARAVAESFGAKVDWEDATKTVIITSANTATPAPAATEAPKSEFPIEYNQLPEREVGYMSNFKLESVSLNGNGEYEIKYTLSTFYEGRGTVTVVFDCYDENGKVVDSFDGSFVGTDYCWSPQEGEAVISGKTVKIELRK